MPQIRGAEQKLLEVYFMYIESNLCENNKVDGVSKRFSRG